MTNLLDLFIFDLAGTTVVDDGQVLLAFERCAAAFGLPADRTTLRARMGWHKRKVFQSLLEENSGDARLADAMAERFEEEFAAAAAEHPLRPYEGADELLASLTAAQVAVAFNTGFSRRTADFVLEALHWRSFVSVASDEVMRGRPAPDLILLAMELSGVSDPRRVGVVGDTPSDLQAGTAASCRFVVGIGHGSHTLAELARAPHTHLVPSLRSLRELIDDQQ